MQTARQTASCSFHHSFRSVYSIIQYTVGSRGDPRSVSKVLLGFVAVAMEKAAGPCYSDGGWTVVCVLILHSICLNVPNSAELWHQLFWCYCPQKGKLSGYIQTLVDLGNNSTKPVVFLVICSTISQPSNLSNRPTVQPPLHQPHHPRRPWHPARVDKAWIRP